MLLVPYSSMIAMMFFLRPVSSDAITIAVKTPITIPSTVRKLRNLWPRTLSSAIPSVSPSIPRRSLNFIRDLLCRVRQGDDGIESRRFERWIDAGHHAHTRRHHQRQQDVSDRNRHGDAGEGCDRITHSPGEQQAQHAAQRAKQTRLDKKLHQNLFPGGSDRLA